MYNVINLEGYVMIKKIYNMNQSESEEIMNNLIESRDLNAKLRTKKKYNFAGHFVILMEYINCIDVNCLYRQQQQQHQPKNLK